MKILVLGASQGTGALCVKAALAAALVGKAVGLGG
jgi:hypothetical protein